MTSISNRGQSVVELVFSIGIVALVLVGMVALIIKSSGGQTRSTARDKAVALSRLVMEDLISQSKNNSIVFWQKEESEVCPEIVGYEDYGCSISYSLVIDGNCQVVSNRNRCIDVVVTINWNNGGEEIEFNRFFSR